MQALVTTLPGYDFCGKGLPPVYFITQMKEGG